MNNFPSPAIILVTGIMAAGKSTIAQGIAERLPRSVHLRGDVFRRMIVSDQSPIETDMTDAMWEQLRLRYRIAATVADLYCQSGFTVVYQDIIIGDMLNDVIEMLKPWSLHIVVLCPQPEVAGQRDADRAKTGYGGSWTPEILDDELRRDTPKVGLWLDTSTMTVAETLDTIFARAGETTAGLK